VPLTFFDAAVLRLRQVAGHEEAEEGAQILEGVFDGRTRQDETSFGVQLLDGLGGLGAWVLNILTFVASDHAPVDS